MKNPKRIGFLCHGWYPDPGGVESHTRDLARELAARGYELHAMCLDYGGEREPYDVADSMVDGVRVRRMAYLYHDHRGLADLVDNPNTTARAAAWVAERGLDLLHVQHLTGFGLGILPLLARDPMPTVMTLHDYWPLCPRGQMMRPAGEVCLRPEPATCAACLARTWPHLMPSQGAAPRNPRGGEVADDAAAAAARTEFALQALRCADRLLTPSQATRSVYVRAGLPEESITVCENGIDVGSLARDVARLRQERPQADGLRLGVLGSVLPSKGTLELARAFQRADPAGCTLEVHGNLPPYHGDSSYVEALQELAAGDARIRLHGAYGVDDLARILAGLDGVAAPSRWEEVYGLTVREASAAGLPVLVSERGGLPAVAEGGRAGMVVGEGQEAWVEALRRFATDDEARMSWREAPRRVRTAAEMAGEVEQVYRGLWG